MKRLNFALIFIFTLLVFFIGSLFAPNYTGNAMAGDSWTSCKDTDPGDSENIKGIITATKRDRFGRKTINKYDDSCVDESNMKQYSCSGNKPTSKVASCSGGRICGEGVCVSRGNTWLSCSDSDPSNNHNVYGEVQATERNRFGNIRTYTLSDVCYNPESVHQYYCDGNTPKDAPSSSCPSGRECREGTCVGSSNEDLSADSSSSSGSSSNNGERICKDMRDNSIPNEIWIVEGSDAHLREGCEIQETCYACLRRVTSDTSCANQNICMGTNTEGVVGQTCVVDSWFNCDSHTNLEVNSCSQGRCQIIT